MESVKMLRLKMRIYRQQMIEYYTRMRSDTREEYSVHLAKYHEAMENYINAFMAWRKQARR